MHGCGLTGGSLLIDEGGGALVVGVVFSQPTPTTPDFKLAPTIGGHVSRYMTVTDMTWHSVACDS